MFFLKIHSYVSVSSRLTFLNIYKFNNTMFETHQYSGILVIFLKKVKLVYLFKYTLYNHFVETIIKT